MELSSAIDRATFDDLKAQMGADFMGELIDTYTAETEGALGQLRQALAAGDPATFRRVAHSIKSSSASLGALAFSQEARELEMMGKFGDLSGAAPRLDKLAADLLQVRQSLEALKNEP